MFFVTKTFYPVGQGGFYSERIEGNETVKTVVYDCGAVVGRSNNGPTPELQKCIVDSGSDKVDILVISHLDEDHINGICNLESYLKQHASRLPLILIPKPTPFDLLLFFNSVSPSVIAWYFNSETQKGMCFITDEMVPGEPDEPVILDEGAAGKTFSHYRNFSPFGKTSETDSWLLKFYVDKSKYEGKLTKEDEEMIKHVCSIDDFEQNKNELQKVYDRVKCARNGSSMSMVSLPLPTSDKGYAKKSFATWLNGDACLKTDEKMAAIEQHFSCLDGLNVDFQIPHHGSHYNLGCLPRKVNDLRTFIWAGFNNKYGHPAGTILNMTKAANKPCALITERMPRPIVVQEMWA